MRLESALPCLLGVSICACTADSAGEVEEGSTDSGVSAADSKCAPLGPIDGRASRVASGQGFSVEVAEVEPDPPALGDNSWLLRVSDAQKNLISPALLTLSPWMPLHGHGSLKAVVVKNLGGGLHLAAPVHLQMPGTWVIRFSMALLPGEAPDDAELSLCVE